MPLVRTLPNGKSQIAKDEAFCELLNGQFPDDETAYTDLFNDFDSQIRNVDDTVTTGALSNAHGDWYEWLLAITAWNIFVNDEEANLAILLPNINQLDVSGLYVEELNQLIDDLRAKVAESSGVEFISSNPDFVVINRELAREILSDALEITDVTLENLTVLQTAFRGFVGRCSFEDIVGYVSVKKSLRPDRRLQIAHEGSLMKALYVHLQTRQWIIDPKGLKYYAMTTEVSNADRVALKTVATHSITSVHSKPQAAVDEVYEVNSSTQALAAFSEVLH